jgi:pimeloyl-ACP methyl ester carboxylesterase
LGDAVSDQGIKVLMISGWASDRSIWRRCADRLAAMLEPGPVTFTQFDPACFDETAPPFAGGHYDLAIGHSAGLPWLLSQENISYDRIASICGFTRFCRSDDFDGGWNRRVIERMARQLDVSPGQVVEEFWNKASATRTGHGNPPRPDGPPNPARLAEGLQALSEQDCRQQWIAGTGRRLVIAGTGDRIVTAEHTCLCFAADSVEWIQTDSHWIPWTFPETCAALLHEMIERP